jgi:hypothetical protein
MKVGSSYIGKLIAINDCETQALEKICKIGWQGELKKFPCLFFIRLKQPKCLIYVMKIIT